VHIYSFVGSAFCVVLRLARAVSVLCSLRARDLPDVKQFSPLFHLVVLGRRPGIQNQSRDVRAFLSLGRVFTLEAAREIKNQGPVWLKAYHSQAICLKKSIQTIRRCLYR
jgi:hypothetical protein